MICQVKFLLRAFTSRFLSYDHRFEQCYSATRSALIGASVMYPLNQIDLQNGPLEPLLEIVGLL